jgi:hypothetical protein
MKGSEISSSTDFSSSADFRGESIALTANFLEQLLSPLDSVDDDYMDPPTPRDSWFPVMRIEIDDSPDEPLVMFKEPPDFYHHNISDLSVPSLDDSDSDMEIPDPDLEFSFELDSKCLESEKSDDSIIKDW